MPTYGVFIVIAVGTIVVGLMLGVVSVGGRGKEKGEEEGVEGSEERANGGRGIRGGSEGARGGGVEGSEEGARGGGE